MGAPEHVPVNPATVVRTYTSPPWRSGSWMADRPGEIDGRQPEGERLGTPGPDQGYALTLVERFRDRVHVGEGEDVEDALAVGAAIAMKRSALFGRAPVTHDITVGLGVWGYLDPSPSADLVAVRREWCAEVHHVHHYSELRRVADAVPDDVLRRPHGVILDTHRTDWRSCLDLDV
jgi:hypothetical protein